MVEARYFDGRSSRPRTVLLDWQDGLLTLRDTAENTILRQHLLQDVEVAEELGHGPRLLRLPEGGLCEIGDRTNLAALLERAGHRESMVSRGQRNLKLALFAAVALIVIAAAGYRWGVPLAADAVAARLPAGLAEKTGQETLELLDEHWLKPSRLPGARREALRTQFSALQPPPGQAPAWRLHFRASPQVGANAFALPGGDIILTDELVALARDDREIMAVLAHELGHQHYRHGLRNALQGIIVGAAVTAWLGDISTALAGLSSAVLEARYSREFEQEADTYAARMLQHNNLSPEWLATALQRLEQAHASKAEGTPSLLSSHPHTAERIEALKVPR